MLSKLGVDGNFLNLIKGRSIQNLQLTIIIPSNERVSAFPVRLGTGQGCWLLPFLFILGSEVGEKD